MLPDVKILQQDGQMNLPSEFQAGLFAQIGLSALGTPNSPIVMVDSDKVAAQCGTGPLAAALRDALKAGAKMIVATRMAAGAGGEVGAPAWDQVAGSTGTVTAAGSSTTIQVIEVEFLSSGGLNEATFRWRLNGGAWSDLTTVQASFAVPGTSVTLAFAEGDPIEDSFMEGASLSVTTTAGVGNTIDAIVAAVEAVIRGNYGVEYFHIVGPTDSSVWVALQAVADGLKAKGTFVWFICETAAFDPETQTIDTFVQARLAEAVAVSLPNVAVVPSTVIVGSSERNAGGILAGWISGLPKLSTEPGEVAQGPLPVDGIGPLDANGDPLLNAGHITLLDTAHFTTLGTYNGLGGVYVMGGRMLVDNASDYRWIHWRRLIDACSRDVRLAGLQRIQGDADEIGLEDLRVRCEAPLKRKVSERVMYAARVTIPAGQDVLSTGKVRVKIGITPMPKAREIEVEIGFVNPFAG
jgi:hypothetical protein